MSIDDIATDEQRDRWINPELYDIPPGDVLISLRFDSKAGKRTFMFGVKLADQGSLSMLWRDLSSSLEDMARDSEETI
jgi:hypothetical protein